MALVIVASRHGGTREIGEVIAATLVDRGLDLSVLNFAERAIIVAARGKQGDRRDMAAVQMWAEEIAEKLQSRARA